MLEHFRTKVGGDDFTLWQRILNAQGEIPSATRYIQDFLGMERLDPFCHYPTPPNIYAQRKDVVGHHIAIGDAREGFFHIDRIWHAYGTCSREPQASNPDLRKREKNEIRD